MYFFVYACQPAPCTDDGCPEWNELANPPENLDVGMIEKEYSIIPVVATDNKDDFVYSLNKCITHLYKDVPIEKQIPRELIIAQAALETGWGESRFANEGNNLFGIRTWDKDEPYLLPIPWTEWPGWGVKAYQSKCESVIDYLHILNNVSVFKDLREVRDTAISNGEEPDPILMASHLDKYASRENYTDLVKQIIKYNLRGVYDL